MISVKDDEICFAKIRPNATIPTKRVEDAGYDMWACFDEDYFVIEPGKTRGIPTGIAAAFSDKYYIQIEERSSMVKFNAKKSAGVFDSGYRGEYFIMTYNIGDKPFVISKIEYDDMPKKFVVGGKTYGKDKVTVFPYKKAVCQAVVLIVPKLKTKELSYDELLSIPSERKTGGFGSSDEAKWKKEEKKKKASK